MGAVDLVIQVESPPSVASGLQRTGRAGHNVGDESRGIFFPKYQGDLVQVTVVTQRMRAGQIEELRMPRNPLDVLAQQIVAMTAMDDWEVSELERVVRRAAPFSRAHAASARRRAGHAVGPVSERGVRRPAAAAGLGPDGRPADRHGPAASAWPSATAGRSRTGACSACSWRAARPTARAGTPGGSASWTRRWSTSPGSATCSSSARRPGGSRTSPPTRSWSRPRRTSQARLPFWKGDAPGRPAELGAAIGAFCRELGVGAAGPGDGQAARRRAG